MSPTLLGFVVFLGCVLFAFIFDRIIRIKETPYPLPWPTITYHPTRGFETLRIYPRTLPIHVCDVPCSDYIPQLPLKENKMTETKPEVGKWYENRYSRMVDRYVIGFKETGEVVMQSSSGDLTHCSLECFHDNYKKKPEIVRKYINVYGRRVSWSTNSTLYDTEEQARAQCCVAASSYIGTYPVDIRLP